MATREIFIRLVREAFMCWHANLMEKNYQA